MECNDPHGGHERVCEGDRARCRVEAKDGRGQTPVF